MVYPRVEPAISVAQLARRCDGSFAGVTAMGLARYHTNEFRRMLLGAGVTLLRRSCSCPRGVQT